MVNVAVFCSFEPAWVKLIVSTEAYTCVSFMNLDISFTFW